jgi:DNA modification methylase
MKNERTLYETMDNNQRVISATIWTPETISDWVDSQLLLSNRNYELTGRPQSVSFRELCAHWPWAKRSDVFTHLVHRYPAKLLAYIPIFFLSGSHAGPQDVILDCFAGTGTVLLESITHPHYPRTCYGVEINPLARLIAKVKTTPLDPAILSDEANKLYRAIKQFRSTHEIPQFPNRDFWFRKKVQEDLARVRVCIELMDTSPAVRDFFRVCLSAIIRNVSWADPHVAPPVKLDPKNFPIKQRQAIERLLAKKARANVLTYFRAAVKKNLARMSKLFSQVSQVRANVSSEIIWDDARSIQKGRYIEKGEVNRDNAISLDGQVGFAITSPPYINAQKYVRTTKFELWWLGLETEDSLPELDKQMIGTERVYFDEYKELIPVDNRKADRLLKRIFKKDPGRAGIVSRYLRDMRESIRTVHKLLKPRGYFALVVGNNTVSGSIVKNHEILAEIAQEEGQFIVESILKDSIRSRGLITKRHDTAGVISEEWILVLRKST